MALPRLLACIAAITALSSVPGPDEGQWLPGQVREMDWDELRARGLKLSRDQLWHPENGGVLSAAIRFGGGCSGSFVSEDGLIATNHHCGFGAINALSTTERNFLRDGFVAAGRDAELPCPGLTVSIVRRIDDVTATIHAAQARAGTDLERFNLTQMAVRELVREGEKQEHTSCRVASFFEGRQWLLYHQTVLKDVRLVYAPPRAIGEFGGEVDNWEWPRHTGDFAFFRAWAAPDGSPREHAADNVPFRPQHFLEVSEDGVQQGDLVMILGYPGSTSRYLTAEAVADREGIYYPLRYRLLTGILAVLEEAAAADDARALELASLIKSLANVQKNALGMVRGLDRNGTVGLKRAEEDAFSAWVAQSPERQQRYGTILDDMVACDLEERTYMQKKLVASLLGNRRLLPLIATMVDLVNGAPDEAADDAGRDALAKRFGGADAIAHLETVQIPILNLLLDEARLLPPDQRLAGTEWLFAAAPDEPIDAHVGRLLASPMLDGEARVALAARGKEAVAASDDLLVTLARGLAADGRDMRRRDHILDGRRMKLGTVWIEAQQAWRGRKFYPDANGTLRVSFASVKGYAPRDGVWYVPHTTVAGVLAKERGEEPFASPPALLAAAERRLESRFYDARVGDVPVCFLSDGDTTGGNSGSCVVDGRGRLVGLNFDRVFENVSGDFGWNAERSRNISVDVRFILWVIADVLPSPGLLAELLRE